MLFPNELARLRKTHCDLDHLPEAITLPKHAKHRTDAETDATLPIEKAAVDNMAFAIIAADHDLSTMIRRSSAPKQLYQLGRDAGGAGVDLAVKPAVKRESD